MTTTNRGTAFVVMAALLCLLLLSLAALPGVGELVITEHAVQRHGGQVEKALNSMGDGGFDRYDNCRQPGRSMLVKKVGVDLWYVTVLDPGNVVVTAFMVSDEGYLKRQIAKCD